MPTIRKNSLVSGQTYHIYTRSIAGFEIFRSREDFERLVVGMNYYNCSSSRQRFSTYLELSAEAKQRVDESLGESELVQLIAYCVMPTHIHLIVKQLEDNGISRFMNNTLNSFTRYFNLSHQRRGPLWESRFKNDLVDNDEQLLHLTRYVHLNPTSAELVTSPEDWEFSSYRLYIDSQNIQTFCRWRELIDIRPEEYRKFARSRIAYQRSLSQIKQLLIDGYTG